MRQEIFKQLFDDGMLKRIEFYGKVMDWHTKWADEMRTIYHINHIQMANTVTAAQLNAQTGVQYGLNIKPFNRARIELIWMAFVESAPRK